MRTLTAGPSVPAVVGEFEAVARIFVGGVLLTAGLAKWRLGMRTFAIAIQGYGILPQRTPATAARAIVASEIAIGACLIADVGEQGAAVAGASMLLAFAGAMAVTLVRGIAADCGCALFVKSERIRWRLVIRNLALAASLMPLIFGSR